MDKTVPTSAANLLDWLGGIEAPKGYNTVYGNNQHKLAKPLTTMTLKEVIAAGSGWTKQFGSSAAGRYQFMKATLQQLQKELGLRDGQIFSADLQDRLGFHLLRGRGWDAWARGEMSNDAFALGIAKEWASIPVLSTMKGAKRTIVRGQSYYAGDGQNKSLVQPNAVELVLANAKRLDHTIPVLSSTAKAETPAAPPLDKPVSPRPDVAPVPGIEQAGGTGTALTAGPVDSALAERIKKGVAGLRAMNPEQVASLVRTVLQVGGAALASKGYVTSSDWETISGGLLVAIVTAWGTWARSDANLLASAASVPAVKAVVVDSVAVEAAVSDHRVATETSASKVGVL